MEHQKILTEFIKEIGVETFILYLNMIFNDDTENSMKEQYDEFLDTTGDMNLAIIECIKEDFSYA
jgi:hypothetical protein